MRRVRLAILGTVVASIAYGAVFVVVAYGLLAGDRRDGGPAAGPGEVATVWGVGLALWLVILWWIWRPRGRWRGLAPGELAAARAVFGDAIAWPRVRVHARPFIPFQPAGTAVSPLGAVHFRREDWLPDFSQHWSDMAWLIHELTHVWQYQTGVPVIVRGLWERRYRYDALDPARPFARYGIEQQAAIVEDWFRRTRGQPGRYGTGSEADYRTVIPFLPV